MGHRGADMNPTNCMPPRPGVPEKILQLGVEVVGHVAAFSVAAFLIISWLLTAPIFHVFDTCRARFNPKANREIRSHSWAGR